MKTKEEKIKAVLEELNDAFESIGTSVNEENVIIDLDKMELTIKLDLNEVEEDNYFGICFY